MRVILVHNSSAGSEDHTHAQLVRTIRAAGHEVVAQVTKQADLGRVLREVRCDTLAVAGGDGTVGHAASVAAESGVPIAILPVGTANNIARSFEIFGSPEELVATWRASRPRDLDLFSVQIGDTRHTLAEAVGFGVFPSLMRDTENLPEPDSSERTLERDLNLFRSLILNGGARKYTVQIDGQDLSGSYLLLEVMNVPFLGPRLHFAPTASPGDGRLDVVLATVEDRDALMELIELTRKGRPLTRHLRSVPARRVLVGTTDRDYHLDGTFCHRAEEARAQYEIRVLDRPAKVLVPERS